MARTPRSPARTLTIFFLGVGDRCTAWSRSAGTWKPALGLDLQGGTRITLAATGDDVTAEQPRARPRSIIDQRVNGSGVAEAEVTTQGNQYIVVEIPGESRRDLVETVKRQAQLRFRVVAMQRRRHRRADAAAPSASGRPPSRPSTSPGGGVPLPSDTAEPTATASPTKKATGKNRPPFLRPTTPRAPTRPHRQPVRQRQPADGARRRRPPTPADGRRRRRRSTTRWPGWTTPTRSRSRPSTPSRAHRPGVDATPTASRPDDPRQAAGHLRRRGHQVPALRRDDRGHRPRRRRRPASRRTSVNWVVTLDFNGDGTDDVRRDLAGARTAPRSSSRSSSTARSSRRRRMDGVITNGQAQISGDFTEADRREPGHQPEVRRAADRVREGPARSRPSARRWPATSSPRASSPASIGLLAGDALLPALLPRPRPGRDRVAARGGRASPTRMVLLLSKAAGFTLTLPGIAGLIVGGRHHRRLVHRLLRTHP